MENQRQKGMIHIHSTDQTFMICVYIPRCVHAQLLSHVQLFAIPWTIACQAAVSMGLFRKNSEVGCHFLLQGILLIQGLNPRFLHLLHWQADSLPLSHLGSLHTQIFKAKT